MKLTVAELAQRLEAGLIGSGQAQISAVNAIAAAGRADITFAKTEKHINRLKNSCAGAVIIADSIKGLDTPQLTVQNVDEALIKALKIFAPQLKPPAEGVDSTAKVGRSVKIEKGVSIGPAAVIEDDTQIGSDTVIGPSCKIGQNTKIGNNCRLDSNVIVYHNCSIGDNVIIQASTTIGATGFGYSFIDGAHQLIPHNGTVIIEDFVEIGTNSCIDRAKFGQTRIGAGTKIGNFVQIAHNVIIGKCCLIVGQVGIAGSCKLGDGVVMAVYSGAADNVEIGDGTIVTAQAGVVNNIEADKMLFGMPAQDIKQAFRIIALTRRLPKLADKLKQLTKRVEKLGTAENNKN